MGWLSDLGGAFDDVSLGSGVFDEFFGKGTWLDNGLRGINDTLDEWGRTFDDKVLGGDAADAAEEAAALQMTAAENASALLDPFAAIGQQGLDNAGFLTDPNAQYDFLQSNPLFQMGLDNLNNQTRRTAAASGRLSGDDTLMQFNNNALLAASPLIADQKASIGGLLDYGVTTAGSQGNLLTGQAAAGAGGIVGAENARTDGTNNALQLAAMLYGASDINLKENISKVGVENGHNIYTWDWNEKALELGLSGSSKGVIAQEVETTNPSAVAVINGFKHVNYNEIGVNHD